MAEGEISGTDIRRAAMGHLARREHSQLELVRKLQKRFGDQPDLIEVELNRLASEGLQSDARLAEAFIRARSNRGQGPVKIRMELRGKGVKDEVIALALDQCAVDWFQLADAVTRKKFGESEPDELKEKARIARFLHQRGFSQDHIANVYQ
jgi:regulatory protein